MREQFMLGKHQEAVEKGLEEAIHKSLSARIWSKDTSLWKEDPARPKAISNALGWLGVAEQMRSRIAEMNAFVESVRRKGFTTVCLLGMGGSSLCPIVCATTFGIPSGFPKLIVIDTTDPASILTAQRSMDLRRTLFIVSSKSGKTIESASLHKYFYDALSKLKGESAGENFVAITDPETPLKTLAETQGFLRVFLNPPDIGGRCSALSYFGLVPLALMGMDLEVWLDNALRMADRCRPGAVPSDNPGLRLGVTLGILAQQGRDKLTFVLPPEIVTFGYWVEQLLAESTGKDEIGILPVEGEDLGPPGVYQTDRVFVRVDLVGRCDPIVDSQIGALERAGHPILRWQLESILDLGGEIFLWEFATAVAGAVLKINPFNQPNVRESKENTKRLIREYQEKGCLEEGSPIVRDGALWLYCDPALAGKILPESTESAPKTMASAFSAFLKMAEPGDYVALLAYVERSTEVDSALSKLRQHLRDNTRAATTVGYGPRYLHSTGQLHKGGANNGLFMQITARDVEGVSIPEEAYSFSTLKKAQALGDFQSLQAHRRRAIRFHIEGDVLEGLNQLCRLTERIVG